jgi:hypothetical protein
MNTTATKPKWKTWHKVFLAIVVLLIIGVVKGKNEIEKTPASKAMQAIQQKKEDSLALLKQMEDSKFEAEVNLRTYITSRLNDPKSFDVITQKAWVTGNTIVVMIDYTAKNAFGGTVRYTLKAEADAKGNIIKVFE